MITELVFLVIFLFFSAFFSSAETALTSIAIHKLHDLKKRKVKNYRNILYLKKNPGVMLATILIGNNLVNIAIASLATLIILNIFESWSVYNQLYVAPVSTLVTTIVVLVFCEVTPKTLAMSHAVSVSSWASPLVVFLSILFRPLVFVLNKFANLWLRLLGGRNLSRNTLVTEAEVLAMLEAGHAAGSIEKDEKEMIEDVLEFGDTFVGEVMTPLDNVISVDEKNNLSDLINSLQGRVPSRIPIYKDKRQNIVGVLYLKDLVFKLNEIDSPESYVIKEHPSIVRQPHTAYINEKTTDVLKRMRYHRIHISIVKNEEEVTVGVVTIEDMIEEIVGEIHDEFEVHSALQYPVAHKKTKDQQSPKRN